MKDYKQLLKELPSNTVVCALGDFDPPTVGHELLVKTVKRLAESKGSAHVIFTSPSKTLQEDKKSQYLKLMFPKTNFTSIEESFVSSIEQLKKKHKNVIVVVGTEQSTKLKKTLKESVDFVTITEKNPDANDSKMKSFASKALYEEFKKKLPSTIRELDGRRLMNDVRHGLGLEPIKEQLVLVKDTLREKYFRKEIFNEGDIVESNGELFKIVKRGSNHLLLKEESGNLVSKWIHDVKPTEEKEMNEGVIQPNGTDKVDPNTPESDTGAKQDPKPKGKTKGFLTFYNYNMKESKQPFSVSDDDKDNQADLDASNQKLQIFDPSEVGHSINSHNGEKGSHHLRRMKVKYHLGEQTASTGMVGTMHKGSMHLGRTPATDKFHDKEAKAKLKATLALKHAKEKEALSHKQEQERANVTEDKDIALEKDAPSIQSIADKHGVSVAQIQAQLVIGMKVEAEHGKNVGSEREIAMDHLNERPDYYTRLKKFVEHVNESVLNAKDPHADYKEKSKALHQLSMNKDVDQAHVTQRKLDLEKEYAKHKTNTDVSRSGNLNAVGGENIHSLGEELDEAKKKKEAVCPTCGKHECECGEQRPGMGTENKPYNDPFFKEESEYDLDITEEEIDQMIESVSDEEIEELYEEHEVELVYEDTGEIVDHHEDEAKIDLMEVLSRTERMKGKIRLRKTAAKRGRSTKIALKRFSNPETINKRARRLAIKLMKKRMLRGRNPAKVSVGEKERIEKILAKRKDVINRVATKLVSRVRKVEKARMSHGKVTKGAMPSVF